MERVCDGFFAENPAPAEPTERILQFFSEALEHLKVVYPQLIGLVYRSSFGHVKNGGADSRHCPLEKACRKYYGKLASKPGYSRSVI